MAADFFLKIDSIKGEAQAQGHDNEIEVLSFSYEGSHSASMYTKGLSQGSGSVSPFRITKFVDSASPLLLRACADGTDLGSVVFAARRPGAGQRRIDYLKYTLDDGVIVSRVAVTGHSGVAHDGQAVPPIEEFEITFQKITCDYTQVGATGQAGNTVSAGYHFVQEQVV